MGWKLFASRREVDTKVVLSYIFDYVIIVVLMAGFYALDSVEPFHQQFSLENYTLHYKFAEKERIPVSMLVVLVVFVPTVIIVVYTLVIDGMFSHDVDRMSLGKKRIRNKTYDWNHRLWELNCGLLGLGLATAAAFTITGALKNAIGKPRPDMIDRCNPPENATDPKPFGLSNSSICSPTVPHAVFKDGFRSFPSGHSSAAFAGLYYLSLYLAGKLHVLDSKGEVWKSFTVLVPTLGAALISGSRIMDARHHPFDVISGSLLGMLVAWGSYRQYFPPLHETWLKGRAYPVRSWGKSKPPPPPPYAVRVVAAEDAEYAAPAGRVRDPEQQPLASPSTTALPTTVEEADGNVFRAQIDASLRHRQQHGYRAGPSSTYTTEPARDTSAAAYTASLPAANPFAASYYDDPDHHYSSGEDENGGLELTPQYTLTGAQSSATRLFGAHSPTQDMAYQLPTAAPQPPPHLPGASTGPRSRGQGEPVQSQARAVPPTETSTLVGSSQSDGYPSPVGTPQPPEPPAHGNLRRGELSDAPHPDSDKPRS